MKFISFSTAVSFLTFFCFATLVFADEIIDSEIVPTQEQVVEGAAANSEGDSSESDDLPKENPPATELGDDDMESSLKLKIDSEEINCSSGENQDFRCDFPNGTSTLSWSNPFFTQLALYEQKSNFLFIHASLNGNPIGTENVNYIPLNQSIRLTVSYERARVDEIFKPYQDVPLVFEDVMQQAGSPLFNRGTGFVFYKGEPGKAEWITEAYTSYGGTNAEREITFSEPGHYFLAATPLYYSGKQVPGLDVDQFNSLRFWQFLATGIDQEGNVPGSGLTQPVAYGILEFVVLNENDMPRASNVLFLPGIKGSKLWMAKESCDFLIFDCDEELLWPPGDHGDIHDLFLDSEGSSLNNVYTKKNEVLSSYLNLNFYRSFLDSLQLLKDTGVINDYEAVPYDWRLSLEDLIENGIESNGKIFYGESSSTPYIEKELRRLASNSQTGKVTIVAHSNGGLVAKALLAKLGNETTRNLVDNVIMVGVPQSGAPQSIGALLFGYGEALPFDRCSTWTFLSYLCSLLTSRDIAREMAENSPMAYQLLPSFSYFDSLQDPEHPVIRFSGLHAYGQDFALYGDTIDNYSELARFLRADDFTRIKPTANDIIHPNVLNSFLLNYAESIHRYLLDYWIPPAGVNVYEVAGWGVDTISGIDFIEQPTPYLEYIPLYRPIFIEDGDGVVPAPSALLIPTSDQVHRFWVNLSSTQNKHSDLLEIESIKTFVTDILNGSDSLPEFFTTVTPLPLNESKKLRFILYAQSDFIILDENGNRTGATEEGEVEISIPASNYDEFGSTKIITIPQKNEKFNVKIKATSTPERITIDIEKVVAGKVSGRSTATNIPSIPGTTISFSIEGRTGSTTPLIQSELSSSTLLISFEEGETIIYDRATSTPAEQIPPDGNSHEQDTTTTSISTSIKAAAESLNTSLRTPALARINSPLVIMRHEKIQTAESKISLIRKENKSVSLIGSTYRTASVYLAFHNMAAWLRELLYTIFSFFNAFFYSIFKS